ncbi:hypothetical protein LSTR_LSTR010226 [Laodelphax striatellus]|uniref:Uncharacterized protein n=1 Tax=Laodelphax striatellus TaxID=195883 RepID=A0A482WPJ7_LAOST|nr:hypothetical protein LSTR_LSTR010226 [Laodelphax striatellus]
MLSKQYSGKEQEYEDGNQEGIKRKRKRRERRERKRVNIEEHQLFEKTRLSPTTTKAAIMGVLDVTRSGPRSDNSIIGYEYHSHAPYTTSFKANDEIRIPIQQQDIYTIPSESYLHVEFKVTNAANAALGGSPGLWILCSPLVRDTL